jgi:uncharacterized membrane protein
MPKEIIVYLLTVPVFFGIDMIWLTLVASKFYKDNLGELLAPKVNWLAAIIFYLLYIIGILVFAVFPAVKEDSLTKAFILGGFLGLIAYSTYDLTNYATTKGWPLNVTMVDIIWGIALTGIVASAGFLIAKRII